VVPLGFDTKQPHPSGLLNFQAEQLCLFGFRNRVSPDLALKSLQARFEAGVLAP
jgi:hypothetical protein